MDTTFDDAQRGEAPPREREKENEDKAESLAYLDTVWLFAILAALMVPLTFLMKRNIPGKGPAGAH